MFTRTPEKSIKCCHHPFTSPEIQSIEELNRMDKMKIPSKSFDLVYNGDEIGGG